jgi:hypothetical protein
LGIHIHFRSLKNGECKPVEDRFERNLASWVAKLMSYGDMLILINLVLTRLSMFMLSFVEIPKGVIKRLDFIDRDISHKVMVIRRSMDLLDGTLFVDQRIKRGLGIRGFRIYE